MKHTNKILLILSTIAIFCLFSFSIFNLALAADTSTYNLSNTGNSINDIAKPAGYQTTGGATAYSVIGNLIKITLSFLGVLFLILTIVSGFQWMMAEGNEDSVKKAKSRIKNATMGLVIVVIAYALTYFILDILLSQTIK
jgi:hypothetical protein